MSDTDKSQTLKSCKHCDKTLEGKISSAKFCSHQCRNRHHRAAATAARRAKAASSCLACGSAIQGRRANAKYCTAECQYSHSLLARLLLEEAPNA